MCQYYQNVADIAKNWATYRWLKYAGKNTDIFGFETPEKHKTKVMFFIQLVKNNNAT